MKHLLSILFLSFIFSGELEVDGDLTVTGNIQNQTIDSLMQVIADLQSQITLMQGADNKLETRVYDISFNSLNGNLDIDLLNLTGHTLEHAFLKILSIENATCTVPDPNLSCILTLNCGDNRIHNKIFSNNTVHLLRDQYNNSEISFAIYDSNNPAHDNVSITVTTGGNTGWGSLESCTADIKIAVTAQFPN